MYDFIKRTWATIDLDYLCCNFKEVRKKVGKDTKIMCVVKADAYGHGAMHIAKELENQGADWFAVSNIDEAVQLRNYQINRPILILGYTPYDMVEKLCNFNISQTILSYDYGINLSKACRLKGVKVKCHLKIDTGMNRIGFSCQSKEEVEKSAILIEKLKSNNKEIDFEGIFTHFATADPLKDSTDFTRLQFKNFELIIEKLQQMGIDIPLKHCCNSGGTVFYPYMKLDMVRAGIVLYGLMPNLKQSANLEPEVNLKPIMELKTVISQINKLKKGRTVSYGQTFTAERDMTIATVPIGYADGYSRSFSGKASMLVLGKRAPIIGEICMDQLMLDITDIDGAQEGTEVVVFGHQADQELSVCELAELINTIGHEVVCLIGKRVPRVYYKFGKKVGKLSYI